MPLGVTANVILAPGCTEVVAVLLGILQTTLQPEGMACRSIVLLVEELVVGVVDTVREENAYKDLGVVDLDVVGWVGIAHVVLGKSLGLGVFLVDRETSGEVGRVGETFVQTVILLKLLPMSSEMMR